MSDKKKEQPENLNFDDVLSEFFTDVELSKGDLGRVSKKGPAHPTLNNLPKKSAVVEEADKDIDEYISKKDNWKDKETKKAIVEQASYLRRIEERTKKLKAKELKENIDKERKKQIKQDIANKGNGRLKNIYVADEKYLENDGRVCKHEYRYDGSSGLSVSTTCIHCSAFKQWSTSEWNFYLSSKGVNTSDIINPDPRIFNF